MYDIIHQDFNRKLLESVQPKKSVLTKKVVIEDTLNENAAVNSIVPTGLLVATIENYQEMGKKFATKCLRGNGTVKGITRLEAHDNKESVYGVTVLIEWENGEDFDMTIWSDNTVSFYFGTSKKAILQRPTDQQCFDVIMEYMV